MRFLIAGLCVFAMISCQNSTDMEEDIISVLMMQQQSWNEGDIKGFMNHYLNTEELTFAGSSGVTKGHEQVLKRYMKRYDSKEKMGQLSFTVIEVNELSTSSAYLIGEWSLKRQDDNPSGYFTLVWEKINGEWKIIHDHTS